MKSGIPEGAVSKHPRAERMSSSRALPGNPVRRQLWHHKQGPRGRSCSEPRMPGVAGSACQRHMHSVHTRGQSTTVSQARRQGDHGGGPQVGSQGGPSSLEERRGLAEFTATQNDTSKSKAELPQGNAPPRDVGRGRVSPPGSLGQNRRVPHLLSLHPQARRRRETHRRPRMLSPRGNSSSS